MNLQIERLYIEAMISEFPRLAPLREQLRFGSKVTLPFHQFSGAELGFLGNLYRDAGPTMRTRAAQLTTLQQAFDGQGTRFGPDDDLEMLMPAIARYLTTDALRGWLFRVNVSDKPLAYVVSQNPLGWSSSISFVRQIAKSSFMVGVLFQVWGGKAARDRR